MLSSYDPASQCRRHPLQPVRGVCAMCLKERLSKIACSRCGGAASTPSRLIATNVRCSCSSLEYTGLASAPLNSVYHREPEYVPKAQSTNGERTIASLIERDILEAPERSCWTVEAPEFCGQDYRTLLQLQRSRSFSVGSNSTSSSLLLISNLDSSSWESIRSSKRSSTELSTHYNQQDNVMSAPTIWSTGSSDHGRQIIRSEMKTISKADIPSKHLQEEKQHVKSMGSHEEQEIWSPQSRGFEEDGSSVNKRSALVSPALCDLKQASLTKSKSTGWVLNYADINWSKASPSFCGLLDDNSAKSKNVKAKPLFSRSRSTSTRTAAAAASSNVNVSTAAANRKSCSHTRPPPYSKHNYGRRLRNFIFQLRGLINTSAATALAKDDRVLSHFQPIMEWKEEELEEASSSVQLYDSRVEELAANAGAVSSQSRKSNSSRSARTRTSSSSPSLSSSSSQSSSSASSSSDTPTNKKPSIASLISMDSQQLTQVLTGERARERAPAHLGPAPSTTSSLFRPSLLVHPATKRTYACKPGLRV